MSINVRGWRPDNWSYIDKDIWMPGGQYIRQIVAYALFEEGASTMFTAMMEKLKTVPGIDKYFNEGVEK